MRKTRSDCRVGTFEKKNGLPPGTVKKPKTPSPVLTGREYYFSAIIMGEIYK